VKLSSSIHRHLSATRTQCPHILAPLHHQWHRTCNHLRCRLPIRSVIIVRTLSFYLSPLGWIFGAQFTINFFVFLKNFYRFWCHTAFSCISGRYIHASGHRRRQISANNCLSPHYRKFFFFNHIICHSHDRRLVPLGVRSSTRLIQFLFSAYP